MKPIVMVAYGGGHVAMLAPVARALLEQKRPVVFLALTIAGAYLERLGLPYITYRNLPGAQDECVQEWGKALLSDLSGNSSIPVEESIAYLGLNYQDLIIRFGLDGAQQAYRQRRRHAFLPVTLFRRWLGMVQPSVVVATSSPRSERAALEAASELGIPRVCLVDLYASQEKKWVGRPGYANRICVLNEAVKEVFIREGCLSENVVVTGNPAFERLHLTSTRTQGRALRLSKGWREDEKVILWASQVEPDRHPISGVTGDPSLPCRVESCLRKIITQQKNFRLVVRYHPAEQRQFKDGQERVEQSRNHEDLAVLLHAVDVVVILHSTVGLEAYFAGRPVISIAGSVSDADSAFQEMGILNAKVASLDLLHEALLVALGKNVSKESDTLWCNQEETHSSTQKVIDVIYSVAKKI